MSLRSQERPPVRGSRRRIRSLRVAADGSPVPVRRVSVVVTCFNYGHFLGESVGSALAQTGVDVDVVIVDDASTDDSLRAARELSKADARIVVIANATNRGPAESFNVGNAAATGQYVVRLDADDLLTAGALERAVALLERFPSAGFVYGHPIHFSSERPPGQPRLRARTWTLWPGQEWLGVRCARAVSCITSPEVVMRREALDRVGGMRDLANTHDFELWLRLSAVSDVGHIDGADQALHRDHPQSLSARTADPLNDMSERRAAFELILGDESLPLPDEVRRDLREAASGALAKEALERAIRILDRGRTTATVERYREFAFATYPAAGELPEWRALRRRLRWGATLTSVSGLGLQRGLRRRVADRVAHHGWERTGL